MMLPIDDNEYHERIKVGTTLKVRFPDIAEKILTVTVSHVVLDEAQGKMAVFIKSDHMTGKFCTARLENAEIIFSTQRGYKVPKSALRMQGEDKCVYVLIGKQMFFRKVEIVFEGQDYIICKAVNGSGTLKPFDDVIVKGTDLYDGKNI